VNLALEDAVVLTKVAGRHLAGEQDALAAYTPRRLPDVWRSQEFTHWMFPEFATHFALAYVGAE
jgi:p-hydroxybenzoate 3-monooxygenase